MSAGLLVLIVLLVVLFAGAVPWGANPNGPYPNQGHFYGTGYYGGGGIGLLVLVLVILLLLGRL